MIRKYEYRNLKGYEITVFGYIIRAEKYTRNIPWELITHSLSHIMVNGYYVYMIKLWKKK